MKRLAATLVLVSCAMPTLADTAWVNDATITRTLIQDEAFGGCMVFLDKPIAGSGLNCPSNWVSLSCDGTYSSTVSAQRMFDSAQMAFALDKKVNVRVNDAQKHNGYCVAYRFDVLK
jgi:hypothetical protein